MKLSKTLIVLSLFCFHHLFSQNEEENSKKPIEYLDWQWIPVKLKDEAKYLRYKSILDENTIEIHYKDKKNLEKSNSNSLLDKDSIEILDGEYKWYDKKGRLIEHHMYEDGWRIWEKSYRWPFFILKKKEPIIHEYTDFTKQYKGDPNSAYYERYDRKGNKSVYYLRKGGKGWAYY